MRYLFSTLNNLTLVTDYRPRPYDSGRISSNDAMIRDRFSHHASSSNIHMIANGYAGHNHSTATYDTIAPNIRIEPHGMAFQQTAGIVMCDNHRFQQHACIIPDMDSFGMCAIQNS